MVATRSLIQDHVNSLSIDGPGSGPQRRDWFWVLIFGAISVLELVFDSGPWILVQGLTAALLLVLLPWRRQFALPIVLGISLVFLVADVTAAASDVDFDLLGATALPLAMTAYALFRWLTVKRVLIGVVVAFTSMTAGSLALGGDLLGTLPAMAFWFGLAALAVAMRYRATLYREREEQVRLTERHDLARELHDTVAHHVSAIAVQAQAAQFVAASNPQAAAESMKNVEELASKTIEEMRRMVGILRSDDGDSRSVGTSSLKSLEDLESEPPVVVKTDVDLDSLPSPVASALYRITQESITNARRHNRNVTSIEVQVTSRLDHVELQVSNDGTPTTRSSDSGYGLIGMQERVTALEGTFESGQRPGNGWQTLVTIPLRGSA